MNRSCRGCVDPAWPIDWLGALRVHWGGAVAAVVVVGAASARRTQLHVVDVILFFKLKYVIIYPVILQYLWCFLFAPQMRA